MRKFLPVVGALSLPLGGGVAQAATGGESTTNRGIVALSAPDGEHRCSAVLVAPEWALTWSDTARCGKSTEVVDGSGHRTAITERHYFTPNDPSKSQAMLIHLATPVKDTPVAKLSPQAPREGEKLSVVAFSGPRGAGHLASVGCAEATVEGHGHWISWFSAPQGMELQKSDAGAPLMRGDEVVGFLGIAGADGGDAEDIANVHQWVKQLTQQG
ncbi:hypothetical protein [Cutibacterium avidum]|nr:hypothetical protein [Cutibacterium avidum]AGJ78871.1 hypothetical protein PALO_11450 [Cutibacterium avidum 44067]MCO6671376.1 hypothetical protein [Cutibacterium avidum]MCO6678539.1 hypothetical protein [Cutibacterium avidum]MCX8467172.1 hypothetical protein [Cutibacterium avidum]MCX8469125.1 hypothetical protein [Cutibacterium avidum]